MGATGTTGTHSQLQVSTSLLSEQGIDEEQARLAVTQVQNPQASSCQNTSTGVTLDSQSIILAELQKINQRLGKLKEQAAADGVQRKKPTVLPITSMCTIQPLCNQIVSHQNNDSHVLNAQGVNNLQYGAPPVSQRDYHLPGMMNIEYFTFSHFSDAARRNNSLHTERADTIQWLQTRDFS